RVRDLVTVEVEDRQNRAVHLWVEELVGVPGCRQRSRLRLPVADDTGHDEVGVVESGAEGMDKRVAEFAAFVDRTRRLWGDVAGYTARKRELAEQFSQSGLVLRDLRITLAVGALEIGVRHHRRSAVAGPADVE